MNINFPKVYKARGGDHEFEPKRVYDSLLKETSIEIPDATKITKHVVKFIISSNIKFLSGPLIREITNVILLQHGLEKQRLEYTRIGWPYADLRYIFNKYGEARETIASHVIKEYNDVKKIIEDYKWKLYIKKH